MAGFHVNVRVCLNNLQKSALFAAVHVANEMHRRKLQTLQILPTS